MADFLRNRSQCVRYGDTTSASVPASAPVSSDIMQGSVLGPTLLTAVINDLPNVITLSDKFLFANDGKAVGAASTANDGDAMQRDLQAVCDWSVQFNSTANDGDAMQRDLQAVCDWSVQFNMPLTMDKSACLHYGMPNTLLMTNR